MTAEEAFCTRPTGSASQPWICRLPGFSGRHGSCVRSRDRPASGRGTPPKIMSLTSSQAKSHSPRDAVPQPVRFQETLAGPQAWPAGIGHVWSAYIAVVPPDDSAGEAKPLPYRGWLQPEPWVPFPWCLLSTAGGGLVIRHPCPVGWWRAEHASNRLGSLTISRNRR